jgi:hypothetical protein
MLVATVFHFHLVEFNEWFNELLQLGDIQLTGCVTQRFAGAGVGFYKQAVYA